VGSWYLFGYHDDVTNLTALRRCRRHAGLTLRALAIRAGTSHPTLAAYEAGRKSPNSDTLERIVEAAGCRLELRPALWTPPDPAAHARELLDVLELAEAYPAEHRHRLDAPIFGRA
jgi:transcriptional regulator with XRE-family HTH domain